MDLQALRSMVATDAALRRRQRLQPAGGQGDKIFPPTYPGDGQNTPPRHVYERRRLGEEEVWCVLVDSVQSQANRLEESLLAMIRSGDAPIPHLVVDFLDRGLVGVSTISSLEAPHRVFDAILRDSLLAGQPFMESDPGKRLAQAKPEDASAVLELSPTALLFGAWHSTGSGGGLGAKFARCLTSEIVAVDVPVDLDGRRYGEAETSGRRAADGESRTENLRRRNAEPQTAGRRTGSRVDPLGVLRGVGVYKNKSRWAMTEAAAGPDAKRVRPSEINHGNIAPTIQPLGITCAYLEHTFVLSFAALRRLRFGSPARDEAARTLLASLGLMALTEQDAQGYALRSRCDLVCAGRAPIDLVHPDGSATVVEIDRMHARTLYRDAFETGRRAGFDLDDEPLRLVPQDKLVDLVQRSQQLALAGEGGDGDEGK